MNNIILKYIINYFITIIISLILLPLFILITIILFFYNKGRVFFVQVRIGMNLRPFKLIKFKTMHDNIDSYGNLYNDNQRITRIGKRLRRTSLDEIPQLINILKGDMTLIGPRPLLPEYIRLYNKFQMRRHEVKPGITGWAQINGRNALTWQEKFTYDVWYVDNMSLKLDIKIILLTTIKVIKGDDVNSSSSVTMEKFIGNN